MFCFQGGGTVVGAEGSSQVAADSRRGPFFVFSSGVSSAFFGGTLLG